MLCCFWSKFILLGICRYFNWRTRKYSLLKYYAFFFISEYIRVQLSEGVDCQPQTSIFQQRPVSLVPRSSSVSAEARSSGSFRNLSLTQIPLSASVRALWTGWGHVISLPCECLWYFVEKHRHTNKQTHKGTDGQQKHTHTPTLCSRWDLCFIAGNISSPSLNAQTHRPTCVLRFWQTIAYVIRSFLRLIPLFNEHWSRTQFTYTPHGLRLYFSLSHTHTQTRLPVHVSVRCAGFVIFHWTHVRLADAKTLCFLLYGWFLFPWRIYHLELIWRIKGRRARGHRNVGSWNIFIAIMT